MPRLTPGSPQSPQNSPVGPGIALLDQTDFTVNGILRAMQGDESAGRSLGALTAAPSFTASPEYLDRTESLVGLNAPFKGAQQITRTDVTCEVEIAELTNDNYKAIHPGLDSAAFLNSMHGYLSTIDTGNAKHSYTARVAGTGGNAITVAEVKAGAASQPTTVSVSGNAITVTLGTNADPTPFTINATANEVINAVNAHAAAKALVKAGRAINSNGTGVVVGFAATGLTGGTAGTATGQRLRPKGFVSDNDYFDNIVMALEGQNQALQQLYVLYNVISLDEISFSPDDGGDISSIGATFTGHVTAAQLDTSIGIYRPPYDIFNFNVAASV